MARIDGADPRKLGFFGGLFTRFVFWVSRRMMGTTLTSLRVAAHHPSLLFARSMMDTGVLRARRVDAALKILASARVASQVGCLH